jgi:PAS domain S-box-containing protein
MTARTRLLVTFVAALALPGARPAHPSEAPPPAPASQRQVAHVSVEQGLSQSSVNCLLQDRQGFVWIGTQEGLNRYDGSRFVVFRSTGRDPASLSDSYITRLFEDAEGRLWVGTQGGGLNRLDRATGRVERIAPSAKGQGLSPATGIQSLAEDKAGRLWVGTWGEGLVRYTPATGAIVVYRHEAKDPESLANNNVWSITVDRDGVVWAGTFAGLNRVDPATGRMTRVRPGATGDADLTGINISAILEDTDGRLWVGTWGKGLVVFGRDRRVSRTFAPAPGDASSLSDGRVWSIAEDQDHHVWIGTEKGGLNEYDGRRFVRHLQPSRSPGSPSAAPGVSALLVDPSGIVWAGSSSTGLYKILPPLKAFSRYSHVDGDPGSLSGGNVWALLEDRDGTVWAGTMGAGLNRIDPSIGRAERVPLRTSRSLPGGGESIWAVVELSDGRVLVAADRDGLYRLDATRRRFLPFPDSPAIRSRLAESRVISIWQDPDGALWFGTLGHGLLQLDARGAALTAYEADLTRPDSLASTSITAIRRTRDGILWLGTPGDGLEAFSNGRFTHYRASRGERNALSENRVNVLFEDPGGALWIGTSGGGLNRLSADRRRFSSFTGAEGLPNDTVYGIVPGNDGTLWLSTNNGICRFTPSTGAVRSYSTSDGLLDREFNQGAYCRGRTGRLYFGGVNGFTSFLPDGIRDNPHRPPVVVTRLSPLGGPALDAGRPVPSGPVTLRHDESSFSVEMAALDYTAPEKNLLRYMLDGFDDGWSEASTRTYATYTRIPPGHYAFRVRGANSDGVWNDAGTSLSVVVLPAPWASRWAYATYVALAGGAIALVFGRRRRAERLRLVRHEAELARERDVSETLRRAEQAVRASEERFRRFMEYLPGIGFIKDPDSRAVYVNKAFEQDLGFSNEQIIGKRDDEYFPPEAAAQFVEVDQRVVREGKAVEQLEQVPTGDGLRYFQTTKFPIFDEQGRVAFIGGVSLYVTDRKRLEQQLLQAQKLESIGTLAGGIAHDFNNLLTIITGYTSLLRSEQLTDEEAARCMAAIEQAVQRGASLVRQILTFARKSEAAFGPVDLNALVRELAEMVRQTFPKTIRVDLCLQEPLPPITADQAQVHQALMNLAVNARDAMPAGGTLTFTTSLVEPGQVAHRGAETAGRPFGCVSVTDTGHGMDEYARNRAFEPFFTTKGPGSGTGLGLAVVYGVVQVHRGFVDLESEPGRGTTFRLFLPTSGEKIDAGPAPAPATAAAGGRSATVLIVEDEPLVRDLLTRVLRAKGFAVLLAQDGEEAVAVYRARQETIDVVLMDYGLPKLAGGEAFDQIRAIDPWARIIIASGNLDAAVRERLEAAGLWGFLQKPYSVSAVADTLRRAVESPGGGTR